MLYLSRFSFPDADAEFDFRLTVKRTCYDSFYPFGVLSARGLRELSFEPVTILYGGNGCGKTTALNVMAEKLLLMRDAPYNRSSFFEDYVRICRAETRAPVPMESRVITSDDVFDFMLNLRAINSGVDDRREELMREYLDNRHSGFHLKSLEDYEQLRKVNKARSRTQSRYVRAYLQNNTREQSNGESAFYYFTNRIGENALYLLDEPENSLSPLRQAELVRFMEDSVRFFGCQFVISTHSPFLLAMKGARVYDLDADPAAVRKWTELPAVRAYYEFFREHEEAFET